MLLERCKEAEKWKVNKPNTTFPWRSRKWATYTIFFNKELSAYDSKALEYQIQNVIQPNLLLDMEVCVCVCILHMRTKTNNLRNTLNEIYLDQFVQIHAVRA